MAFIKGVSDAELTPALQEVFGGDRAHWGFLPNYARTFALRPEVYQAWQQLVTAVKSNMDLRRYELATLGAAAALRSSYCSLAHGRILARRFLPAEGVAQIITDRESSPLDPAERAIVAFAEKVALHADRIGQEDVDALREHGLTDAEILDVVLAAAVRCFFSKTLDATGTHADASLRDMEPALRDALTVGRPIAAE